MKRIKQIMGWCAGLSIGLLACTDDRINGPITPGDVEIRLSGVDMDALSGLATRAIGQNESNLYLTAVVDETNATYIAETRINCPQGLADNDPRDLAFVSGSHYYPLGQQDIRFFAYSGKATAGEMTLTAGNTVSHDALLSNYGYRKDATLSGEGKGTFGSSNNPATILNFRHVMTQLNVVVEVDAEEEPGTVTQVPRTVEFNMNNIPATGKYSIYATAPDPNNESNAAKATNTSGSYRVKLGTNYVIPNGADLTGQHLSYLKIDDFVATADDLSHYTIEVSPDNAVSTNMVLLPGYAYTMTFLVQRLKVIGIKLEKVNWVPEEIDQEGVTYVPHFLELDLGQYTNAGADTITKTVMFTQNRMQYIGRPEDGGGDNARMQYVTLPAGGEVDSIQLYTKNGLLIATSVPTSVYDGSTLTLALSPAGMLPVDNSLAYDPDTNPYAVTNPHQFINISKAPGDSYRQMINIDMDALVTNEDILVVSINEFTGYYDGREFWISNMRIAGPGLVRVNKGTIIDLRLESGHIDATGQAVAGSFCGTNEGTIFACVNQAQIINATGVAGGICGENTGQLIACVNMGDIPSGTTIGGICGNNRNQAVNAILACFNTGMLHRKATNLGGICGTVTATTNVVLNTCFWLVGTAGEGIGTPEVAVGGTATVGMNDVSDVSPERLRNQVSATENPATDGIVTLLNNALSLSTFSEASVYSFILDQIETASVWPIAIRQ